MLQAEFNTLYDGLKRFANQYAYRYFPHGVLRLNAVDKAMDKFVDKFIENQNMAEIEAKNIIKNSIRNSSLTNKLEPIELGEEFEGMHGYQIKK